MGDLSQQMEARPVKAGEKPNVDNFEWGEELGEGAFGTVRRAKLAGTGEEFAIKILEKKHVIKMDKVKYVTSERDILFQLDHPNVIKLHHTFQDKTCLYFVMELAPGGELFEQIQKHGPANHDCAVFYAAEIVNALGYLHSKGIVHRDLKPENMLVAGNGHIKISDFGSATVLQHTPDANKTFVGTAEYVSPEVLNNQTATRSADLWALGCVIFQLLAGRPPFRGGTDYIIFQKILNREFRYPDNFGDAAKDLVENLLVLEPSERLGADGDMNAIRQHPFFEGIDFENLQNMVPPPYKPERIESGSVTSRGGAGDEHCALASFERGPLDVIEVQSLVEQQASNLSRWRPFLLPTEAIVMLGMMNKRVGLFARPRLFILTTFPRLMYINIERMEKRGEIPWVEIMQLELFDATTLHIHTKGRTYYLEQVHEPTTWIDAINFLKKNPTVC